MPTGSLQSIELASWQARRQSYPLEFTTEKNFRGAFKWEMGSLIGTESQFCKMKKKKFLQTFLKLILKQYYILNTTVHFKLVKIVDSRFYIFINHSFKIGRKTILNGMYYSV